MVWPEFCATNSCICIFLFRNFVRRRCPFLAHQIDGNDWWHKQSSLGVACMRRYGRLFTQCMCTTSTFIHELHWTMKLDIRNSGQWSVITWRAGTPRLVSARPLLALNNHLCPLTSSSRHLLPTPASALPQSKEERQGKSAHRHTRQTRPRHSGLCAR